MPNGLFWDDESGRLLVACYRGRTIYAWRPGDAAVELFAVGPGCLDGMERLADGRLLISSSARQKTSKLDMTEVGELMLETMFD